MTIIGLLILSAFTVIGIFYVASIMADILRKKFSKKEVSNDGEN